MKFYHLYLVVMSDVKNFVHNVLAVVFQYLHFRRKLSSSSIKWYHFPVVQSLYAEVTLIQIFFPYQLPLNKNAKTLHLYYTDS